MLLHGFILFYVAASLGNFGSPFRSNSAIDMNALRRAKAIRAGPGFPSAARLPRGSGASLRKLHCLPQTFSLILTNKDS